MALFDNRHQAAHELAKDLSYLRREKPVVLGLANGGVPIAEVIAKELDAPMDVLLLERLSAPSNPDHIVGAVDEHGRISMIQATARWHHLTSQKMIDPARDAFRELKRKRAKVRSILPEIEVRDRTVLVVSQGIGTGAKMLGAIASVRDRGASKIIAVAPAGATKATWQLHETADQVVIPHRPSRFTNVSDFYREYSPVSDELMLAILEKWVATRKDDGGVKTLIVKVPNSQGELLCVEIDLPPGTTRNAGPFPAVIFCHGFESDARSPRTVPISRRLAKRNIIGVRFDFTGHGHSEGRLEKCTDEHLMADLQTVHEQVLNLNEVDPARIGLNGAGTGGMFALRFAAARPEIAALVIRGPVCGDEIEAAHHVHAPTLLIHAERDTALRDAVESLNRELHVSHQLLLIPDSSRLFNDPISHELMVSATVDWLVDHLVPGSSADRSARQIEATEPG